MKFTRAFLAWLLIPGCVALAQIPGPGSPGTTAVAPAAPGTEIRRSATELETLLAPIALYPDALLALILPAATAPADVVLAARFLREPSAGRTEVERQAWDESVKSLAYYPEVLKWMDENLGWTKQVGEAFAAQPAEVMQAIQRLRSQARAAGTLVDTPQQQVIADLDLIRIVPTQVNAIYVPYYQPTLVFLREPLAYPSSRISFGVGRPVGSWLAFECDWRRSTIWMGNRHRPWTAPNWHRPLVSVPLVASPYTPGHAVRPWRPSPTSHSRMVPLPPHRMPPKTAPNADRGTLARTFAPRPSEPRAGSHFGPTERHVTWPRPTSLAPLSVPQVVPAPSAAIPFGQVPAGPQGFAAPAPAYSTHRGSHSRPATAVTRTSPSTFAAPAPNPSTQLSSGNYSRRQTPPGPPAYAPRPAPPSRGTTYPPPAQRTRPPPTTAPASAPAAPPEQTTGQTESSGERSIGRRQPNAHLR